MHTSEMTQEQYDLFHVLLKFQADVKVELIKRGIAEYVAHDAAAEIAHVAATSPLASPKLREFYTLLSGANADA